ncbi:MAG: signal peptidase I [Myxococcota bacterium]|nr:signal peptidase I [Myxococcota bacterium]
MSQDQDEIDLEEIAESLSKSSVDRATRWDLAAVGGALMTLPVVLPWYLLTSNTNAIPSSRPFLGETTPFEAAHVVSGFQTTPGLLAGLVGLAALVLAIAGRQQARIQAKTSSLQPPLLLAGWLGFFLGVYAFAWFPRSQGNLGIEDVSPYATITAQLGPFLFLSGASLFVCAVRGFPLWFKELIRAWGPAILIVLTIRNAIAEPFRIPSGSMVPTLEVGDHILVSKVSYGVKVPFTNIEILPMGEPEVGDTIVFRYPVEPWKDYIKRIVAGPGDTIKLENNRLVRNGIRVGKDEIERHIFQNERCHNRTIRKYEEAFGDHSHQILVADDTHLNTSFPETTVPEGHYFVMGDNRHNSEDSRWWGFVPRENIKGKAKWIWLSYNQCEGSLPIFGSFRGSRFGQAIP